MPISNVMRMPLLVQRNHLYARAYHDEAHDDRVDGKFPSSFRMWTMAPAAFAVAVLCYTSQQVASLECNRRLYEGWRPSRRIRM